MVIGVDPGSYGGICVIDDNNKIVYANKLSNDHDDIIEKIKVVSSMSKTLFLESPISVNTNKTICNKLFFLNGFITGVSVSFGIDVTHCHPSHWKKYMKLSANKDLSIKKAIEIFGNFKEMAYSIGSTKDGIAEAALIAYYGKNINTFYPDSNKLIKPKKQGKARNYQTTIQF